MTDRQQQLRDLAAAEREAPPDLAAEARNWAAIERRLIQGPGPPNLPDPALGGGALLKWIGGLALVGGLVGGGLLLAGPGATPDAPVPEALSVAPGAEGQADPPRPAEPVYDGVQASSDLAAGTGETNLAPQTGETNLAPQTGESNLAAGTDEDPKPARPAAKLRPGRKPPPEPSPVEVAPAQPLDLAAELKLLASIRAALRRGDPAAALAGVAEHRRTFGAAGALVQERSALEVEAVCAAGRGADARRLAGDFLRRYPDSPHRALVEGACAEK